MSFFDKWMGFSRNGKQLTVRVSEITAFRDHEIYIKGMNDPFIVSESYETILKRIMNYERE